jgi:hypothetical protein
VGFRRSTHANELRCSFCRKSQDSVQKLIANPSDDPNRAYICDECVSVCAAILEDIAETPEPVEACPDDFAALLNRPLTPQLLAAVERWITEESLGAGAPEAFAELRATAIRWMQHGSSI